MIEHHYTIIYNSTTGSWYWDSEEFYNKVPDGTCYDTSAGKFFIPDPDNPAHDEMIKADLDGFSKVNDLLEALNASSSTQGE